MEPHRPPSANPDSSVPARRASEFESTLPAVSEWLEREAIRYLARWETTRQGLTEKLERKLLQRCERSGEDPGTLRHVIPELVEGLSERGYVDDRRYAEQLYERLRRQGSSRDRIRARLHAKGVDSTLVAEIELERARARAEAEDDRVSSTGVPTGESHDEDLEAAWQIARKRRLGPFHPDPTRRLELRNRHLSILARRGFSHDVAHAVVDAERDAEMEIEHDTFESDRRSL